MNLYQKIRNIQTLYGKTPPSEIFLAITNACNMTCSTCTFGDVPREEHTYLDTKMLSPILDHLKRNDIRMISITGGEPLLHPDFLDICREVDARKMMISYIATNGILLDERIASGLSRLNVNIVGLSVDVVDENGMGITRKMNIGKVIPRVKRLLDKYNLNAYAGIVLGSHIKDIHKLMEDIRSWGFTKVIFSYPQVQMGSSYRAANDCEATKLSIGEWKSLIRSIEEEKKRNKRISIFNTKVNLEEFLRAQSGRGTTYECPGGVNQFYVDWKYDLYRCFNESEHLGNLIDMEKNNKRLSFTLGPCRGCTQQAFLDYGSFYHAFKVVKESVDTMNKLKFGTLKHLLKDEKNKRALRSLFEAYRGGFV